MGPRVLVVDNYDSFVYNLVQELGELGAEPVVYRNDAIDVAGIRAERPDAVLISPGPGRPEDGGVSLEAIAQLAGEIPLLGVCLGHQCIGQSYGGTSWRRPHLMHGKTSEIHHDGQGIFAGLPNPFVATRYHSLVVRPDSVPDELEVTATSTDGVVMGLRHRTLRVEGVQFHPESVLTVSGPALLANFLGQLGAARRPDPSPARRASAAAVPASVVWGRSSAVGGRCVVVVVVVVDVVVVVVADWHTEMLTVRPAVHLRVRPPGSGCRRCPAGPRSGTTVSKVVLATRPAPVMAEVADALRLPDDTGDRDAAPGRHDEVDRRVGLDVGARGRVLRGDHAVGLTRAGGGLAAHGEAGLGAGCCRRGRATARPRSAPRPSSAWPRRSGGTLRVSRILVPAGGILAQHRARPVGCWSRCGRCSRGWRPGGARWPGSAACPSPSGTATVGMFGPPLTTRFTAEFFATDAPALGSVDRTSPLVVRLACTVLVPTVRWSLCRVCVAWPAVQADDVGHGDLCRTPTERNRKKAMTARATRSRTSRMIRLRVRFLRSRSSRLVGDPAPPGTAMVRPVVIGTAWVAADTPSSWT